MKDVVIEMKSIQKRLDFAFEIRFLQVDEKQWNSLLE